MKYLTSKQFFDLCELSARMNGKTTETVRAALNFLINGDNRIVMYVGYNNPSCDHARKIATQMLMEINEVDPRFEFEIIYNNRYALEFLSAFGRSVLRFSSWTSIPNSLRGMTLDEIFFDIDPETMFKGSNMEGCKILDTCASVVPMFAYRRPRPDHGIKIF